MAKANVQLVLPDVLHKEDHNKQVHNSLEVGQCHRHLGNAVSCKVDHHSNHNWKIFGQEMPQHDKQREPNSKLALKVLLINH